MRIAVIAEPNSSTYFDTLAQVQIARGEVDEAVKWAEKAVLLNPGSKTHQATLAAARRAEKEQR